MSQLEIFMTDFCPFAQRLWLTVLEKESNPDQPTLFKWREVNYFNPNLPETKEFLAIHNTVPCGRYEGEVLKESMPMAYWVDAKFPQNPLQPASEEGKARMKALITKFTSGQYDVVSTFYNTLFVQPEEDGALLKQWCDKLLVAYRELNNELAASKGAYLLGDQFTLADIALIPFIDRAELLLRHFKGFEVPQTNEYAAFHAWKKNYRTRPSHRVSDADRLPRSVAVQPFAATKRNEYIIEMYQSYGNNVREQVRKQLLNAPPGVSTQDIAAAKAEKAAEANSRKQNRIIFCFTATAVLIGVAARLISAIKRK